MLKHNGKNATLFGYGIISDKLYYSKVCKEGQAAAAPRAFCKAFEKSLIAFKIFENIS